MVRVGETRAAPECVTFLPHFEGVQRCPLGAHRTYEPGDALRHAPGSRLPGSREGAYRPLHEPARHRGTPPRRRRLLRLHHAAQAGAPPRAAARGPARPARRARPRPPPLWLRPEEARRPRGAGPGRAARHRLRRLRGPEPAQPHPLRGGLRRGVPPSPARPRGAARTALPLREGPRGGRRARRLARVPLAPARHPPGPPHPLVGGKPHPPLHRRPDGDRAHVRRRGARRGRRGGERLDARGLARRRPLRCVGPLARRGPRRRPGGVLASPRHPPRLPEPPPVRKALPHHHRFALGVRARAAPELGGAAEARLSSRRRPSTAPARWWTFPGRRGSTPTAAPSAGGARRTVRPTSPASPSRTRR